MHHSHCHRIARGNGRGFRWLGCQNLPCPHITRRIRSANISRSGPQMAASILVPDVNQIPTRDPCRSQIWCGQLSWRSRFGNWPYSVALFRSAALVLTALLLEWSVHYWRLNRLLTLNERYKQTWTPLDTLKSFWVAADFSQVGNIRFWKG